jgi:hypothetical protein
MLMVFFYEILRMYYYVVVESKLMIVEEQVADFDLSVGEGVLLLDLRIDQKSMKIKTFFQQIL